MTQPTTRPDALDDVHAPPPNSAISMTYHGRELYLIPCITCAALIPITRADWWNGTPSTAVRQHDRWHNRLEQQP